MFPYHIYRYLAIHHTIPMIHMNSGGNLVIFARKLKFVEIFYLKIVISISHVLLRVNRFVLACE